MGTTLSELIGIKHIEALRRKRIREIREDIREVLGIKMKQFEVNFSYDIKEWGTVVMNVDNEDDATVEAMDYVRETFPDAIIIEIDEVKEIKI